MSTTVNCIFVHGWAMNSAVWDSCVQHLPDWINVVLVDLPGHGSMSAVNPLANQQEDKTVYSGLDVVDCYVNSLTVLTHRPSVWVGWSMGGLAVTRLAELFPERVAALLLVSSNPCFVEQDDWSCAVSPDVFMQFAANLEKDQQKTIQRFLALQVRGAGNAMSVVRQLQRSLEHRGQASKATLVQGLQALMECDFRPSLNVIDTPIYWLLGGKDTLVPATLAAQLSSRYGQSNIVLNPHASHAPFLSHEEEFVSQLVSVAQQYR